MGCIFSSTKDKLKCPLDYDSKKFQAVCMLFDDLDFNGNRSVGSDDLAQGLDPFITDFFLNRESNLENMMELNQNVKKKLKLKSLEKNKDNLANVQQKLEAEVVLNKNELDNKLKFKEQQIATEHEKLDNILKDYKNTIQISKINLDNDAKLKIEALYTELENQIRSCEKFYQDKYNRLNQEKKQLDELLTKDDKKQIRLRFIQYLNNQQQHSNEFNLNNCLMYFKNKSLEETMVLLKFINKNKFNFFNNL